MEKFLRENLFKLCVIMGIVILIFTVGGRLFSSEIISYPVLCQNEVPTVYDCVDATPLNRRTYKVDKEKEEVISWMPGLEEIILIERYTKCVILDAENWTCEYDDSSREFGFNKGNYIHQSKPEDTIYVSKEQWEKADAEIDYLESSK